MRHLEPFTETLTPPEPAQATALQRAIELVAELGLWTISAGHAWNWNGCDYCSPGLANEVHDCNGFQSYDDARLQSRMLEFRVCDRCLRELYYKES